MAEIKGDRWTPADTCTYLERLIKIKRQALHDVSSSRAT